jgi:glycosyltransferase involved in cell wall biosynthesis
MDRFFWAMHEQMAASGWEVEWVFPASPDVRHYQAHGFRLTMVPKAAFFSSAGQFLQRRGGVDLLVTHFVSYPTLYSQTFRGKCGVRSYIAVDHMSRPMRGRRWPQRLRLALKGAALFSCVDRVIAVSGFVKESIRRELGRSWWRKVEIVRNGVDQRLFHPADPKPISSDGGLRLLACAHLIPEKGVQVLIEALALARPQMPPFHLGITGSGPYESELRALVDRSGLADCVAFTGSVNDQHERLGAADVAFVPSLWQEACGFVVLETLAAGVPLVASSIGGIPEFTGDEAAMLVPAGNAQALAAAMVALGRDPARRRQMGEAASARARRMFTLERMVDEHLQVMRRELARV